MRVGEWIYVPYSAEYRRVEASGLSVRNIMFAPFVMSEHDRRVDYEAFKESMGCEKPRTIRLKNLDRIDGLTMLGHHLVRAFQPDGTVDVLFVPESEMTFSEARAVLSKWTPAITRRAWNGSQFVTTEKGRREDEPLLCSFASMPDGRKGLVVSPAFSLLQGLSMEDLAADDWVGVSAQNINHMTNSPFQFFAQYGTIDCLNPGR